MSTALEHFKQICTIPHGSGNERELSNYLVRFAKNAGLEVAQDDALNVYIYKPASPGYENKDTIILQGHMDMVCEKDKQTEFDFATDPLNLKTDGDFLYAEGTTLGADDGVALAYQMAIIEDTTLKHPPLCLLITTEEETGMGGVIALDRKLIQGNTLINLDSDIEGEFLTSCAGGLRIKLTINGIKLSIAPGEVAYTLKLRGLKGGHSGAEIHKERANANVVMGRVLDLLNDKFHIGISSLDGGSKDNVIAREADAVITVVDEKAPAMLEYIEDIAATLKAEYAAQDADISLHVEKTTVQTKFMSDTKQKLIDLLRILPNGVVAKSCYIADLVETSLNLGVISTADNVITITLSLRSSVESKKIDLTHKIKTIAKVMDVKFSETGDYPAWQYKQDSRVRDAAVATYRKLYGVDPEVRAVHAGLECGILSLKIDDLDAISFGPNVYDIHTPKEKMSISSFEKMYGFLITLLEEI
ncbi:aminoacyl-histidine dipeptidase [Candidatus Epulonipiscium viviparus]|uniref:aminoacyl-histidine dipeptidase n=1 Tax=Candidatus Epulonipiscium viviparus TaxID=420336 RepID=UPI0027380684|nr:aminoacyl-histidine dipeptidase [Candidatus Epulopiscium viviparus]